MHTARLSTFAIAITCLTLSAGTASAQTPAPIQAAAVLADLPPQVAPKDRNAAIKYLGLFPQLSKNPVIAGIDWDAIGGNLDASKMPEDYKAAAKSLNAGLLAQLREAAALEKCDFENHYEEGWGMLLPSLGNFRQCVRLLRVDTREAMIAGDLDRATANLVAGYQMVRHVSRDPIMICSLVGAAMVEYMHSEALVLNAIPTVTREQKRRIADAIRALGQDPVNIRASIEGERSISLNWMRGKILESDASGRNAVVEAVTLAGNLAVDSPEYVVLSNLSRDELLALVDRSDLIYRDLSDAWDTPDALDRLRQIEEKLTSGGYGLFAQVFAPAIFKVHKSTGLAELHLQQLVDELDPRPQAVPAKSAPKSDAPSAVR